MSHFQPFYFKINPKPSQAYLCFGLVVIFADFDQAPADDLCMIRVDRSYPVHTFVVAGASQMTHTGYSMYWEALPVVGSKYQPAGSSLKPVVLQIALLAKLVYFGA